MDDQAICNELLPRVSRTFAPSIEALPEPLRGAVRASYLLCRIADTIEDDPGLAPEERERRFALFQRLVADDGSDPSRLEQAYCGGAATSAEVELCQRAGSAFRQFRALTGDVRHAARPNLYDMAAGMAHYARRWHGPERLTVLADLEDLHRYCFFVSGNVGILLTDTFVAVQGDALGAAVRRALRARSVRFGYGLQMTNIVKDVHTDHRRGWCFLPATVCGRHGVAPDDLLQPAMAERSMRVVHDVADLAREHLDRALEYTLLVPAAQADLRLFLIVPLALAHGTLSLVASDPRVLTPGGVKLSRDTVGRILAEAREGVEDDDALRDLCANARAGDYRTSVPGH